jgi:hypothetical protein
VAVNLIVLAVTLILAFFVIVWVCSRTMRRLIEEPKYSVLQWRDEASRERQRPEILQ